MYLNLAKQSIYMSSPLVSLVTGGAGFIGNHLCRKLLFSENHQVICLDNLSTGHLHNIQDLLDCDNKNFSFIQGDVTDPSFASPDRFPHLDYVWNLACPASPSKYQLNGLQTLKTIVNGTENMLELAVAHHARFLLTSTSEIYGDPEVSPQPETYWGHVNPVGPRSCYDEGKRCAETLVYETRKQHPSLQLKIVRIFNTYGPRMDLEDGRVITNFINSAKNGNPLPIYGSGQQTRSFCYVSDTVNGLLKMMNSPEQGPINIGNPYQMVSINQLWMVFNKVFGHGHLSTCNTPLPTDDPKIRQPDITLAINKLNWAPTIDLETGLTLMLKSYQKPASSSEPSQFTPPHNGI